MEMGIARRGLEVLRTERFKTVLERLRFSVIGKDYDLFARPWEPCFG